jgi:hypothetical protein
MRLTFAKCSVIFFRCRTVQPLFFYSPQLVAAVFVSCSLPDKDYSSNLIRTCHYPVTKKL